MGRKLTKMTEAKVEYFINNYSTKRDSVLAKELGVDRTTLFYWADKLRKHGIRLVKNRKLPRYSSSGELIGRLKSKLVDKVGTGRGSGRINCGRKLNKSTSRPSNIKKL